MELPHHCKGSLVLTHTKQDILHTATQVDQLLNREWLLQREVERLDHQQVHSQVNKLWFQYQHKVDQIR